MIKSSREFSSLSSLVKNNSHNIIEHKRSVIMKFKIISDSASDLTKDYLLNEYGETEIGFETVPFIVTVNKKDYVDDGTKENDMLFKDLSESSETFTSCPSPYQFEQKCNADYNFIVTISSKLSGSYNSACTLKNLPNKKVFIIDSKGTAGSEQLIIDELYHMIKSEKTYTEICKDIVVFRDELNLCFTLSNFDNLVKKGRIKSGLAKLIQSLKIKLLCCSRDGEISLSRKCLNFTQCLRYICAEIRDKISKKKKCIITYTDNYKDAVLLKEKLSREKIFDKIVLVKAKLLNSFYAQKRGLIVSY